MKRGRRFGQTVNPRDSGGWMIPRAGTKRREVYERMIKGQKRRQIAEALHITEAATQMHMQWIRRSRREAENVYLQNHPERASIAICPTCGTWVRRVSPS